MLNASVQRVMFELIERDAWLNFFAAAPADCGQAFGISSLRLGDTGLLASREWLSWSLTVPCASAR